SYIPIVASVSERQPTAWLEFLHGPPSRHHLVFPPTAGRTRVCLHLRCLVASIIVYLMFTLTPVVCMSSAVELSAFLDT
ncbi:glycosyltransferase family 66 protein, partial [Amanita muscaria Koide BX008]